MNGHWAFLLGMMLFVTSHPVDPPPPPKKEPGIKPIKSGSESFLTRKSSAQSFTNRNPGTRAHKAWKNRRRGAKNKGRKR